MPDVLLALGLLLSTATQLRIGGSPLGPGEICILLWLGLILIDLVGRPVAANSSTLAVLAFGFLLVISECAGLMMGMAVELFFDVPSIVHDIVAYTFLICATTVMSIVLSDHRRLVRVIWLLTYSGAIALLLQFGDAKGWINLPGVDPWHFDRLRGWSNDPNQLGFASAILFFLAVYLATESSRIFNVLSAVFCCAVALVAGILTKSDTFVVCVAVGTLVFLIITCGNWLRAPRGPASAAAVCIGLLAVPLVLAAAAPFAAILMTDSETYSEKVYNRDDQGDTRLRLWSEAASKGLASKLIGFGPGPHLLQKAFKRSPPDKFESHNTTLELFTQGGFVASLAFLGFIGWSIFRTCRAGISSLAAMSFGLLVFSMFHFVLRHPVFWFGIVVCLIEAERVLRENKEIQRQRTAPALNHSSATWTST